MYFCTYDRLTMHETYILNVHTSQKKTIFLLSTYAFSLLAIEINLCDRNEYDIPLKFQETKTCTNIYEENKARYFQCNKCMFMVAHPTLFVCDAVHL